MLRRTATSTALLLATLVLLVGAAPAQANSFFVRCDSSHVLNDDPIVFPGVRGASHRHEFFGARSTNATTTTRSLVRSATTCHHLGDTAAYWSPTLEVGRRLHRGTMVAYYQRAGKARAAAPPIGLRIIAGDMHATTPQSMRVTSWQCTGVGRTRSSRHARYVPRCRTGQLLSAWVRFPDCWNGHQLDSADHRSHMAYSRSGRCPASHPARLMKLVVRITWRVRPNGPRGVRLGGGMLPATGFHADFWNAWHMPTLRQLRWDCIEVARTCGELRSRRQSPSRSS